MVSFLSFKYVLRSNLINNPLNLIYDKTKEDMKMIFHNSHNFNIPINFIGFPHLVNCFHDSLDHAVSSLKFANILNLHRNLSQILLTFITSLQKSLPNTKSSNSASLSFDLNYSFFIFLKFYFFGQLNFFSSTSGILSIENNLAV